VEKNIFEAKLSLMSLASIQTIQNIRKHPNADSLEIANVLGWQVIVKKDIHRDGDKVVFITIDTIVPRCQWSEFLVDGKSPDKPLRVKNIKLRGEYSSGLVIPLEEFSSLFTAVEVGENVTDLLGIKKYIKELPVNLSGESIGEFPTHIAPKTDEVNGLTEPEILTQLLSHDYITVTQKCDGSSITIIVNEGNIDYVCSRNLAKKETDVSVFWRAARQLSIPEKWSGIIQGELCGPGIQCNPMGIEEIKIFVYQIKTTILDESRYLTYDEMRKFCQGVLSCDVVPLVAKLNVKHTLMLYTDPLNKLQELADKQTYPNGGVCEGVVVRPSKYPRSIMSRRPLGFKLINRNYKD
jgi:RNA ligase (TIGR02306 family)